MLIIRTYPNTPRVNIEQCLILDLLTLKFVLDCMKSSSPLNGCSTFILRSSLVGQYALQYLISPKFNTRQPWKLRRPLQHGYMYRAQFD